MITELKNRFDFFIRNHTKFSRKNFKETNPDLIERNRLENLYTTEILNKYFKKTNFENVTALDIGCKNWFYAKGEHAFFEEFCSNFSLDGVELDAYRLYSNLYSRYEVAKFFTTDLKNTNYIAGNLLDIKKKYDYIIWFLPFVAPEPLIYWGLPKKYFCPEKLLKHAYDLLSPNGQMLIINQGEKEAKIQENLLQKSNIKYTALGEIKSKFFEYKNKRLGFIIEKD